MKFKKDDLIRQIDHKIKQNEEEVEAEYQAELDKEKERRAEWFENSEEWLKFANKIKEKIRKDRPLLIDDIPKEIARGFDKSRLNVYVAGTPKKRVPIDNNNLKALKRSLEAVEDEDVTTTGLKAIGFEPRAIRSLFY